MRRPGDWVDRIWWEQKGINLESVRERRAAAADGKEERGGEETAR